MDGFRSPLVYGYSARRFQVLAGGCRAQCFGVRGPPGSLGESAGTMDLGRCACRNRKSRLALMRRRASAEHAARLRNLTRFISAVTSSKSSQQHSNNAPMDTAIHGRASRFSPDSTRPVPQHPENRITLA